MLALDYELVCVTKYQTITQAESIIHHSQYYKMISAVLTTTAPSMMKRYEEPENDEAVVCEGNTRAHLHAAYYEPIKDCKPRMTASASSTINLDSLLASITNATEMGCKPSDSSGCLTTSTSLCTSLASSASGLSSSSTNSFSLYADGKRKKSRGLSRSIRYSSDLSSLPQCQSLESRDTSPGTKRSLDEIEGTQWGYFVDTREEEGDYYDIDFSNGPIASILDVSNWDAVASASVNEI